MTVAFQHMFRILERWNNNQVTPSLSKPHELSYRSNIFEVIGMALRALLLIKIRIQFDTKNKVSPKRSGQIIRYDDIYDNFRRLS